MTCIRALLLIEQRRQKCEKYQRWMYAK